MSKLNASELQFHYDDEDPEGFRAGLKRFGKGLGAAATGMSIYELPPGQAICPYHYEYAEEEWLVVLEGTPTLRTPEGERTLKPGDVVHFPRGAEGAHQVWNAGETATRFVVAAANTTPEVVEYPDSGKIAAMAKTPSQRGPALWSLHFLENATGYWDGEG